MRLAAIHIRLRGRVDQRIELQCAQRRSQLFRFPKIKLRVVESNDAEQTGVFPDKSGTEPSASTHDDEPLHSGLRNAFEAPSSKHQAPEKHQKSNTKAKFTRYSFWNLELGISLELGAWDLELPARSAR